METLPTIIIQYIVWLSKCKTLHLVYRKNTRMHTICKHMNQLLYKHDPSSKNMYMAPTMLISCAYCLKVKIHAFNVHDIMHSKDYNIGSGKWTFTIPHDGYIRIEKNYCGNMSLHVCEKFRMNSDSFKSFNVDIHCSNVWNAVDEVQTVGPYFMVMKKNTR